jgi:peptidoglycan/LPS O-acetylase OafA/YrhL
MPKLAFAQQMRGIAALLIVITHYFGIFFGAQQVVSYFTATPDLQLVAPSWTSWLEFPVLKGPFGVALFFLISGFVIPFSLQHNSVKSFLVARLYRIYPTYLACLGIGLLAVWLATFYWESAMGVSFPRLMKNALLIHNLSGTDSLDGVNWTLAIEMKFYLVAALAASALLRPRPLVLAGIVAGIVGLNLLLPVLQAYPRLHLYRIASGMSHDLNFIIFMLMGTLFYQHYRELLSTRALAAGLVLLSAAFAGAWLLGEERGAFPIIGKYYYYALGVFSVAYVYRARFRAVPLLDFLADISYPLYVVHPLLGYTLLKLAVHQGVPFGVAVVPVLAVVLFVSWVVHRTVETRSNQMGKKKAGAMRRPLAKAA